MLRIELWCEGVTALLQNRATEESLSGETRTNTVGEREDPRTIASRTIYRMPDGKIGIIGTAFARMVREAGGAHKAKGSRKSLKYIVPAAVVILDDLCPLYLNDRKARITDFEVDSRPVTIPATKGRVMRHRARFNEWSVRINVQLNENILSEQMLRQLFIEGSQQIGVGDYRPEKGGPFGTSQIVQWQVLNQPKLTEAQRRAAA